MVGASPRELKLGGGPITSLREIGFSGKIFAVNPKRDEVLGLPCFPSVAALPATPEAAVISVPSHLVPDVVRSCGQIGIGAVVVGSAGFAEAGPSGKALQRDLVGAAHEHGIALCGPNNIGILNVLDHSALWTVPVVGLTAPGPVAVISHSGSVAMALAAGLTRLGLAHVVSAGNEAVLGVGDYVAWLAHDERVRVIAMFLETIRNPAALAEACDLAHKSGKVLLAVKVGRTEVARRVVAAHSAGIAGDDRIVDAYLSKLGVIRLTDLDELVSACELFVRQPSLPKVPGCGVITMSGGEAALAGDMAADLGLSLPALAAKTRSRLRAHFPPFLSPGNPLDAYGLGYTQERFRRILDALVDDPGIGTVVIATDAPLEGTADSHLARQMAVALAERAPATSTCLAFLNNAAGGGRDTTTDETLAAAGIPYLLGLREGLSALAMWSTRSSSQASVGQTVRRTRFHPSLAGILSEDEEKRFRSLSNLGLPMVETVRVSSPDEAADVARRFGFPVVMKGTAPQILHKTELKLISLHLGSEEDVRQEFSALSRQLDHHHAGPKASIVIQPQSTGDFELIVGVRNDTSFGSVVVVGLGGIYTEVFQDTAVAIGPVDAPEARALLRQTRIGALLEGRRSHGPYDIDAIGEAIALFSRVGAVVADTIAAIEINPLIVGHGLGAVSAVDLVVEPRSANNIEESTSG